MDRGNQCCHILLFVTTKFEMFTDGFFFIYLAFTVERD